MYPRYILSDNRTEFKNSLMDQVLQQLGIDRIFSAPYHPQSNGKLQVFYKYLKPKLKKLCEKRPIQLGQILESSSCQLQNHTKLGYCRNTILFGIWKGSKSTLAPTVTAYEMFSGRSWFQNVEPRSTQASISFSKENPTWKQIQNCPKDHGPNTTILQDWRQSLLQKQTAWQMGPKMEARK